MAANINVISFTATPNPVAIGSKWTITAVVKNQGTSWGKATIILGYWTTAGKKSTIRSQVGSLSAGAKTTLTSGGTATSVGAWRMFAQGPDTYIEDYLNVVASQPLIWLAGFTIKDAVTLQALAGAVITVSGFALSTNSYGEATFTVLTGTHDFSVAHAGYEPFIGSFDAG